MVSPILTCDADELMIPYHDRMPVILREEELKKAWLNAAVSYPELRAAFMPRAACHSGRTP